MNAKNNTEKRRIKLGVLVLIFVLIAFVVQTELIQFVQKNLTYNKPYFILWLSHTVYILAFPIDLMLRKILLRQKITDNIKLIKAELTSLINFVDYREDLFPLLFQFKKILFCLTFLLTSGAYLWYLAAGLTSMSSLTAIYNTSCFFAYVFSIYANIEIMEIKKNFAVLLSLVGIIFITLFHTSDESNKEWSFMGNIFAVVSAIIIGLYEVVYKKYATSKDNPSVLFSSFIGSCLGLLTLGLFWIFIPILHFLKVELFELPGFETLKLIMLNALMGLFYNIGILASISLTSPVITSVAVMITIPLVSFVDFLIFGNQVYWNAFVGAGLILAGFLILLYSSYEEHLNHESDPSETSPVYLEVLSIKEDEVK